MGVLADPSRWVHLDWVLVAVGAVGDCACGGGLFGARYASFGRVSNVISVRRSVPGCPPPLIRILRGMLTVVRSCRTVAASAGA